MRTGLLLAVIVMTSAVTSASQAQTRDTGIRTETQERLAMQRDKNLPWNIIGLLGLLGLLGLRRPHREDSYHPSSME